MSTEPRTPTAAESPTPAVLPMPAERSLLWQLAGADLLAPDDATSKPSPLRDEPLTTDEFDRLLAQVRHHRIPGVLLAAVLEGLLPVTDAQRTAIGDVHRDACASTLGLERRLLQVVETLEAARIEVVVLKGTAHAHLLEPDPAMRHFGDLDLLVRAADLERAIAVLERDRGARRDAPELRRGYDRRFAKGVTLVEDGVEIDLHRTLLYGTFAYSFDPDELFDRTVTFEVGGRHLRALGPEHRLLHVCYHAGLGDPRPRANSLRDVGRMLTLGLHDDDRLLAIAQRWRSMAVLARGVELARTYLGVAPPDAIERACRDWRPSAVEQRAVASYVGANRSHTAKVRASLPFLPDTRTRAAFLVGSFVPSRGFVRGGTQGRLGWVRQGLRSWRR